jgi:hypothetical protein
MEPPAGPSGGDDDERVQTHVEPRASAHRHLSRRLDWRPRPPGRQFDDDRRAHRDWPLVLAEGDSWFAHPIQWNILYHLSARGGYAIRRLASIGDELHDMVREAPDQKPQFIRQLERRIRWDLLLASGGGNDLLGDPLPDILRHRSEVSRGWRGLIDDDVVESVLGRIRRSYQRILFRSAQLRPECQVLAHGYDYPYPRDKGATIFWGRVTVTGPWMHPVMVREKGIHDKETQQKIVAELVDRLNRMLRELAAEHERFHYVDLRGTLTSVRQWDDEIHPKGAGFRKMAGKFRVAMDRAMG